LIARVIKNIGRSLTRIAFSKNTRLLLFSFHTLTKSLNDSNLICKRQRHPSWTQISRIDPMYTTPYSWNMNLPWVKVTWVKVIKG